MKHDFVDYLEKLFGNRFLALVGKEVAQILHNRQLLVQLLVPPTVFLILFGLSLNPTFENLRVGITDYSHSRSSRELIEVLSQTDAFRISRYYNDPQEMQSDLAKGKLTVGLTIPLNSIVILPANVQRRCRLCLMLLMPIQPVWPLVI